MTNDVKVENRKLSEFLPDDHNANKGTQRGLYMLETSVGDVGFGRPMVADKAGKVVAGNKTQEVLIQAGIEDAIVIHTDGTRPIIHVRDDWNLDDPDPNNPARRYAYFDNRTNEIGFALDVEQIKMARNEGFDFSALYFEQELDTILGYDDSLVILSSGDPEKEKGDNSESSWPFIIVQVSPETMELYESLREQVALMDDDDAMKIIFQAVDRSVLNFYRKVE